jgi:uncharacterized metal-binding protein
MTEREILCSYCERKRCFAGDLSQAPDFCPTLTRGELIKGAKAKLREPETQKMAQDVARTWKDYGKLTRVEETILYARLQGHKKLGLAFCVGLAQEAELLTNLLINEGFEVASACCMCGALCSDDIGLPEEDKIMPNARQPMCNPIGQAMVLDSEDCDLNIILGLCVGDDVLFIKHSKAPVTVLAVKDRVLAHNPLGALYTARQIYTRLNVRKPKTTG